jgi:hypothetical protein
MAHRIRLAMKCEPAAGLLKGDVQVDETYVGPSRHGKTKPSHRAPKKRGRGTDKQPVLALVETNGNVRSRPIDRVDANTLKSAMEECIDPSACIVTDELKSYPKAAAGFSGHETVKHSIEQYVNDAGYHTNTAESYFALLKRGLHGSFHHVSRHHLHRYCDEFSFRWNGRKLEDSERRELAIRGVRRGSDCSTRIQWPRTNWGVDFSLNCLGRREPELAAFRTPKRCQIQHTRYWLHKPIHGKNALFKAAFRHRVTFRGLCHNSPHQEPPSLPYPTPASDACIYCAGECTLYMV